MASFLRGGQNVISRLRVKGEVPDPLAARLRLESWLGAADLQPRTLPASAIVCVRRLSAPPVALGRRRTEDARGAWHRTLADTLDRVAARAARPIEGAVPPAAEAVVFYDRAELLACLALDWRAQSAQVHWWWRAILKGGDAGSALLAELMEAPACIPAALEHLARAGAAAGFVGALGADEARALSSRVAQVYGLHELSAALAAEPRAVDGGDDSTTAEAPARTRAARGVAAAPAPWRHFAPESRAPGIAREQECLLGVGLTLTRAPSYARSPAFARDLEAWRAAAAVPPDAEGEPSPVLAASLPDESRAAGEESEAARPEGDGALASRGVREKTAGEASSRDNVSELEHEHFDEGTPEETAQTYEAPQVSAEVSARARPNVAREVSGVARQDFEETRPSQASAESAGEFESYEPPPYLRGARVETGLGGLFYLINVGLFLELYGDFTTPLRPGIALSTWDFVALVGRRLLRGAETEDDAVWPLLARLAGRREGEPPGLDFEPPEEWRLPASWLAAFPEAGVWRWSSDGGRLRVRHQEGFLLLDVPHGGGDASLKAQEETARYAPSVSFELRRGEAERETTDEGESAGAGSLERWVEWLGAYVSARLCRALGGCGPREAAGLLLEREARVTVTATHVDVLFRLAELPIEVRLSGLDRDPGWVPAAGRHVAFRYE